MPHPDHLALNSPAAGDWSKALPLGSGRLGAMVFGDIHRERIQFNEDSLWSGGPRDRTNPDALEALPEVRRLILAGTPAQAHPLIRSGLNGIPDIMRHYEPLTDLIIEQDHGDSGGALANATAAPIQTTAGLPAECTRYARVLDLADAEVRTSYDLAGVTWTRTALCSHADGVFALRLGSSRPARLNLRIRLQRGAPGVSARMADTVRGEDGCAILMLGASGGEQGIRFAVNARVSVHGGSVRTWGEDVWVNGADAVVIVVAGATSFRHADPRAEVRRLACQAQGRTWDDLRQRHLAEYRPYWDAAALHLEGDGPEPEGDVPARLARVRDGAQDVGLQALYGRYGRYLLIAASRPGSLPANLQGIWNQEFHPPWGSKWTVNINTEMNYWPAEPWGLAACHGPLFDHLERVVESGRKTARQLYGCRGFVCHHNTDIWADTWPVDRYLPASYWPMGGAWLALHLYDHWDFARDPALLPRVQGILREAAQFFLDFLIEDAAGRLVTCPTSSPENTFRLADGSVSALCAGSAMDSAILDRLFRAVVEVSGLLGVDGHLAAAAEAARRRLPPLGIGGDGRLLEWPDERDEVEPGHRHISHLWALHPGDQIHPTTTPELAIAARKAMDQRLANGGGHTGWSRAWILNFSARLGDGAGLAEHFRLLLAKSTMPNLLDDHPPFQIDGNFGATAAIAEALAQGHAGDVLLLPALPAAWRKGHVRGLRLRGGWSVDLAWAEGRLTGGTITSTVGGRTTVHLGNRRVALTLGAGERRDLLALFPG